MNGTPTAGSLGADPAALESVAAAFRTAARRLVAVPGSVDRVRRSGWSGPDAMVVTRVAALADRDRHAAADALVGAARHLDRAARDQRRASVAAPTGRVEVSRASGGGRLVQRVGRADAPVVVVVVPGVGSDPGDGARLLADARRLWRALADRVDDPDRYAVVSWLDYDPPDLVLGAVDPRPADEGAARLVDAVRRARAAGARHVTVVGHSYGAVVAGRAAVRGLAVDLLVQLGAPGVGLPGATRAIAASGVEHLTARERDDPIGLVPAVAGPLYGEDPVGRVAELPTSRRGHGAYLRDPVLLDALARRVLRRSS